MGSSQVLAISFLLIVLTCGDKKELLILYKLKRNILEVEKNFISYIENIKISSNVEYIV